MGKQVNPNIGMVRCAHCGQMSALRREKAGTGKFYYDCLKCGRIKPNMPAGQQWIMDNATIWNESAAPANAPEWIVGNHTWRQALTAQQQKPASSAPPAADLPPPPPPPPKKEPAPSPAPKRGGFPFLDI